MCIYRNVWVCTFVYKHLLFLDPNWIPSCKILNSESICKGIFMYIKHKFHISSYPVCCVLYGMWWVSARGGVYCIAVGVSIGTVYVCHMIAVLA